MVRCTHKDCQSAAGDNFAGELPKFCKTRKLEGMVHTIDVLAAQTPAPVKRSSTELEYLLKRQKSPENCEAAV